MDIQNIDKNLKVETSLDEENITFYDVRNKPFEVYGLYNYSKESVFKRLPDDVAKATSNEGVKQLYLNTAGGRVRFSTDSKYVAIKVVMPNITRFSHMPLTGTSGFDLFINEDTGSIYYNTFVPPYEMENGYESIVRFSDKRQRSITINFPLYNNVDTLYIGIEDTASLSKGSQYKYKKPVLYYGSSITQGGCASRPGNSYQSIISRNVDCDYFNLGFSGSARGEDEIVEYMAQLDISVFVCDYDHNAPTTEHLLSTHERLYKNFRKSKRDVPIIFVTRPDFYSDFNESIQRRDIIYMTYINAVKSGDKNVYFIDGKYLFKDENRDVCTVDGAHPNDAGFLRMAEVIGCTVKKVIAKRE